MALMQVGDIDVAGAEDSVSIQRHISAMQNECKKACPNEELLADRMSRTLIQRRTDIPTTRLDLLLEQYPPLSKDHHVSRNGYIYSFM